MRAAGQSRTRPSPLVPALLLPGLLLITLLLGVPLASLLYQSVLVHRAGTVGAASDAGFTIGNYAELLQPAYLHFLLDTVWLSAVSAALAVMIGLLFGYRIARTRSPTLRKTLLSLLVVLMFLSVLVRIYAIALTFGPVGAGGLLLEIFGLRTNSREYAELMVALGFLHFLVPMGALMLVGTVQNINPTYFEAASTLGAPRWRAHLSSTIPLAAPGLVSAFLVTFSLAVSSFVIPLILGRGKVQFLANLTYARFSEVADYPSGAAIAIVLLAISLAIVGLVGLYGRGRESHSP